MKEPVERTIDGRVYTFYRMSPMKSVEMIPKILNLLGPGLVEALNSKGLVGDVNVGALVGGLFGKLDSNNLKDIVNGMLEQVHAKGKGEVSQHFDELFTGDVKHLFKVVFEAMKVEYSCFFVGLPGFDGVIKAFRGMTQDQ